MDSQILANGKGAQHGGLLSREGNGEGGRMEPACLEQIMGGRETTVPRSSKARLKIKKHKFRHLGIKETFKMV